jgi:hypothetical protein
MDSFIAKREMPGTNGEEEKIVFIDATRVSRAAYILIIKYRPQLWSYNVQNVVN